jgi:hypothetical protein
MQNYGVIYPIRLEAPMTDSLSLSKPPLVHAAVQFEKHLVGGRGIDVPGGSARFRG